MRTWSTSRSTITSAARWSRATDPENPASNEKSPASSGAFFLRRRDCVSRSQFRPMLQQLVIVAQKPRDGRVVGMCCRQRNDNLAQVVEHRPPPVIADQALYPEKRGRADPPRDRRHLVQTRGGVEDGMSRREFNGLVAIGVQH